jgi:serine protease Do
MATDEVPVLRREAIVPSSDRGRLAAIVATCSLAGLAGGMALSMLAETQRAAREMRASGRYHADASGVPVTWLGLRVTDAKKGDCTGALVKEVTANGPADRVGFHAGDVVISYDGARVCSNDHLIEIVRASDIGASPEIEINRRGAAMTLEPTLAEMPPRIRAVLPPDQLR